ncbi:hypothetical protein GQ42DRAFT_47775 [Ramicandelaber brevisporus]|nr:hypothetical protein GQ42DRAFT_47775 [Ramicandelaber brevisporus]
MPTVKERLITVKNKVFGHKLLKKRGVRVALLFFIIVAVWAAIAGIVAGRFRNEWSTSATRFFFDTENVTPSGRAFFKPLIDANMADDDGDELKETAKTKFSVISPSDRVHVNMTVVAVDLQRRQMSVVAEMTAFGALVANGTDRLAVPVLVDFYYKVVAYDIDTHMTPVVLSIPLLDGNPSGYPNDEYNAKFRVAARTHVFNTGSAADVNMPISLAGTFSSGAQTLSVVPSITVASNDPYTRPIAVKVTRTSSTRFIVIFTAIAMWLITIGLGLVTLRITLHQKTLPPPPSVMVLSCLVLLALVALRYSQPGAPPIGSLSDYWSFLWCMLISSAFAFDILLTYVIRYRMMVFEPELMSSPGGGGPGSGSGPTGASRLRASLNPAAHSSTSVLNTNRMSSINVLGSGSGGQNTSMFGKALSSAAAGNTGAAGGQAPSRRFGQVNLQDQFRNEIRMFNN